MRRSPAFDVPGFRPLWLSLSAVGLGTAIGHVAIAWVTLELTDSALAVAATVAIRLLPLLVLGIPLGSLADRVDRRRLLIAADLLGAAASGAVALVAVAGGLSFGVILVVSLVFGIVDTIRTTTAQAYVYDIVGARQATSGIALSNLSTQLASSLGAFVGGAVLATAGVPPTFLIATAAWLVGAALLLRTPASTTDGATRPTLDLRRTVMLLLRSPGVAAIAVLVILAEVFGFSTTGLVPTFAKEVLLVDAAGLGVLVAARSVGGVVGLAWLATLGARRSAGVLIIVATAGFGLALATFAVSTVFVLSVGLMFASGAAAATLDSLGQVLLQRTAPDHERGAAMGIWVVSIGFGPIGVLALGAAAEGFGAPIVQAVSGSLLVVVAVAMARVSTLAKLR